MSRSTGRQSDSCADSPGDATTSVLELKRVMQEFIDERNWHIFHNAKNLSMSLAIEAAELMEHFQWLTTEQITSQDGFDRTEVADELADVVCYALSLANALEIDVSTAVHRKMIKNRRKYPPASGDQPAAVRANRVDPSDH